VPGDTAAQRHRPEELEHYRVELTGYCYRMLGSVFEAEDAVQDTFVRAWRGLDRFEGRSALRSWLYHIATNVCFDQLNGRRRRARPVDLGPASSAGSPVGPPLTDTAWLEPVPDAGVLPAGGDPAEQAVHRDTIRLAFVAALQHLPPRQRAVLILREVLRWKADEVADLLGTSAASVNSALQRARTTLASRGVTDSDPVAPMDATQRSLVARYVDAFERFDIDSLVSLLHEDATQTMPPYAMWLRGREELRTWWRGPGGECRGSRLVPVAANAAPAFAQYRPGPGGAYAPWSLQVLRLRGHRVAAIDCFLDTRLFARFGLPPRLSTDEFRAFCRSKSSTDPSR
jgi:RNA polymerase sigma-70 factor (ECF subfamily)